MQRFCVNKKCEGKKKDSRSCFRCESGLGEEKSESFTEPELRQTQRT